MGRGCGPGGIFRHNMMSWTVMNVRTHSRLTITVAGVMEATMEPRNGLREEDIVVERGREVEVVEVGSQCGCRYIWWWVLPGRIGFSGIHRMNLIGNC